MGDQERYLAACHAVQSGVAAEHSRGSTSGTPKHLRTGLDIRACDHAALVRLLVAKGVFTAEEYGKEIADEAEREVKRYESRLTEMTGVKITLA